SIESTVHSLFMSAIIVSMRARLAGVAYLTQSSDGRQVGHAGEISTILPLAFGNHFTNSVLSLKRGRMIVSAVSGALVPGLHAIIVASSERARGDTRSMCDGPRRQPNQVPYCSRFASMPHDLYVLITQSLALVMPGLPVRRGPMESRN